MQARSISLALVAPLIVAAVSAPVIGQSSPSKWTSKPATAADVPVTAFAIDPLHVIFDRPTPDQLWARTGSYKACFGRSGTTFVPFLGSKAPRNYPVHLDPPSVTVDGVPLKVVRDADPRSNGSCIEFARAALVESYELTGTNMEQTFRFDDLPKRGELVIRVPIDSELAARNQDGGLLFEGPHGGVKYSQAVAIDARGEHLRLATTWTDQGIEIVVPSSFARAAALPLIVDPLITAAPSLAEFSPSDVHSADIAYDVTHDLYTVVWALTYSATDIDVYARRLDRLSFLPIGGIITIDSGTESWERPRIADNRATSTFLVVGQRSNNRASPFWVAGRTVSAANGSVGPIVTIARAGLTGHLSGDKINPDVGGDPSPTLPSYFTVVWERVYSASDHDIHMKQLSPSGVLQSASPTLIDNSIEYDINPSISKSDGRSSASYQSWAVVWERQVTPTDHDIYGSLVTWSGALIGVGGGTAIPIDTSARNDVLPAVSSPTDEQTNRVYLVAFQGGPTGGDTDIYVQAIGLTGTLMPTSLNLQVLELTSFEQQWPQSAPAVACDGCRFVVGYHESFNGLPNDQDVRLTLLGYRAGASTPIVHESRVWAAGSPSSEQFVSITAVTDSNPALPLSHRYAAVWRHQGGTYPYAIEAIQYDGFASSGGTVVRQTACGSATLGAAVSTILGDQMQFDVNAPGAFTKAVMIGLPTLVNLAPLCSGCALGVSGDLYPVPLTITIPCMPALVGGTVSFQGLAIYPSGQPCLNTIGLTNTIDVTVQ